jgi:3-phenylpropionate/trans-cinnamate dioxygenase ferredoxin reductase component
MAETTRGGPIVIVGGGMAGGNAAVTLRQEGYRGQLTLVSSEPGVPFGRPPLSKTYLRSEEDLDGWYVKPAAWYEENEVERPGQATVASVDTTQRTVLLSSGEELGYQRLLLATGGRPRRFTVPSADLTGIHYLRTVADCDAIKRAVRPGLRAVVVGMSFIGCEVAASLTQLGVQVTTVFPEQVPLQRVLGAEVGAVIGAFHRANGVELLSGERLAAFEGAGAVQAAVTASGTRIPCDLVVAGIGIDPVVPILQGTAAAQDNGLLTDELCRTTAPDVYAAGDVANIQHPLFGRVRVEHYNNAEKQGRAVAKSMLGSTDPYDYLYTFWSDQYDHKLEYAGYAATWDDFVVRGSLDEGKLIGFYLTAGVVRAAVGLDRGGDPELDRDSEMAASAGLVATEARPAPGQLADDRVDLWSLASGA